MADREYGAVTLVRLAGLPSAILMTAFVGTFFSYADLYLDSIGLLPVPASEIFLVALAGTGLLAFARCASSAVLRREVAALYAAHLPVIVPLAAVVLSAFLAALLPDARWDDGARYVLFPVYDAAIVLLSMLLVYRDPPRRRFRGQLLVAFLVLWTTVVIDAVRPGTFSMLPDRAAGFGVNPNTAGFLIVALCSVLLRYGEVQKADLVLVALTSIAVLVTLSRGGVVMLAMVVGCYAYSALRARHVSLSRITWRATSLLALGTVMYVAAALSLQRAAIFDVPTQRRASTFFDEGQVLTGEESRTRVLVESLRLAAARPVMGYGSGFTYSLPVGPHNMYVQQWLNTGLLGMVSFMWLLVAAGRTFQARGSRKGVVFIAVVAIQGLFSHNLLDERIFLALLGALLADSFFAARGAVTSAVRTPKRQLRQPAADRHAPVGQRHSVSL